MDLQFAELANFEKVIYPKANGISTTGKIIIPHYQRPYSWDEPMIEQLISDWYKSIEVKNRGYFSGAVVTALDECSRQQLIDGQQRFTTIYLLNFLRFLLLRVCLRETHQFKTTKFTEFLSLYLDSYQLLFNKSDIDELKEKIEALKNQVDEIRNCNPEDRESSVEKFEVSLKKILNLPEFSEAASDYLETHHKLLYNLLNKNSLVLEYSRDTYNKKLVSVLSKATVTLGNQSNPALKVDYEGESNNEIKKVDERYAVALKVIFNSFYDLSIGEKTPIDKSIKMITLMTEFLNDVGLCLITTGSEKDAYILFEVLNDRSMSLTDLDLIKNDFYKRFCLANKDKPSDILDVEIEERDNQWGEAIFPEALKKADSTYISYFYSVFLSGSTDYKLINKESHRKAISDFLDKYRDESYSKEEFKMDFTIFEFFTKIVTVFDLRYRKKDQFSLESEYKPDASRVYKTMHFLNAMDQPGVLVAVAIAIVKYYLDEFSINEKNIDADNFTQFLTELSKANHKYKDLENLCQNMWKISLMSKDYTIPKRVADDIVEYNNFSVSTSYNFNISGEKLSDARSSFESWLDVWKYGEKSLHIKTLFSLLIKGYREGDSVKFGKFNTTLEPSEVGKIELDHMEPKNPRNESQAYFLDDERDYYVNGLGNIFPLLKSMNISKSAQPFYVIFEALKQSGLKEHWLVKVLEENIENNHSVYMDRKVPTREFFIAQKSIVKKLFLSSVDNLNN